MYIYINTLITGFQENLLQTELIKYHFQNLYILQFFHDFVFVQAEDNDTWIDKFAFFYLSLLS